MNQIPQNDEGSKEESPLNTVEHSTYLKLKHAWRKFNESFRMWQWWLITLLTFVVVALAAPQKLGTTLYALSLLSMAFLVGYWGDRLLFPHARPHLPLIAGQSCMDHGQQLATDARGFMEAVQPGDKKAAAEAAIQSDQHMKMADVHRKEGFLLFFLAAVYQLRRAFLVGACVVGVLNRL